MPSGHCLDWQLKCAKAIYRASSRPSTLEWTRTLGAFEYMHYILQPIDRIQLAKKLSTENFS
jgi:hypothetical protein